jgi:hypothetical protein
MSISGRVAKLVLIGIAGVLLMAPGGCPPPALPPPLNTQTLVPTDPCTTNACVPASPIAGATDVCPVSSSTFNTWFKPIPPATTGVVTLNGVVNPANSVSFNNIPNCAFYQWAMQDFLWLTSPAPPEYGGGGGLIVDSPTFYDVTPPAADGSRSLLPHTSGFIRPFALRAAQPGPEGLQVTFDSSGTPIEVKPAEAGAPLTVVNAAGQRVQVTHARLGTNGKPILLDQNGGVIQALLSHGVKPQVRAEISAAQVPAMVIAQKFIIDGIPIFIDPSLAVIDVEQGEAGTNGVLEAQTSGGGSLVYYATIVNDVYAFYATELLDHTISLAGDGLCTPSSGITCFPTTGTQLNQIVASGAGHFQPGQTTFPDANALAIEVKSAWVVAAGLPNPNSYITLEATIPVYNPAAPPPSGTTTMTATGTQQTVKLALVGMHVVGSAAGHPEMVWSTFEHVANAPAATYSYINASGTTATVSQNVAKVPVIGGTSTSWVFSSTTASSFNNQNMSYNFPPAPGTITANTPPGTISPSDTMRWKAFGAASDIAPNPVDPSIAASNTEIIALDNSVGGLLVSGDVRANYVMTGATWTIGGASPGSFIGGNQVGTSSLSNTTMETYVQGLQANPTKQSGGFNCLSCHTSNNTNVSHVFGAINKPLF